MMDRTSTIPKSGVITADGVKENALNTDSYIDVMTSVATGMAMNNLTAGAAGMSSPTANRLKARSAEGMIPLVAAMTGETSGIGWRIISEPVQAAVLNEYTVVTDNPKDAVTVKNLFDDMRIWKAVERATVLKRQWGWSVLVMGPEWVRSHAANWITPSNDWYTDYNSRFFGLPEGWKIELKAPIGGDVFVYQEDSILFGDHEYQPLFDSIGVEFGTPILTRPYAALQRLGLSHELILSILSLSVQDIYQDSELDEDMKTKKGQTQVAKRIGGIAATRHLNDIIAIGATEAITRIQSSMTGTAEIIDVAIKLICAETGYPASMLAERQSGLSNSDTSADAQWQNLVSHINTNEIIPALKKLAMRYTGIRCEFVPNKSQGQIDREVNRDKTRAETAKMYYDMRAITSSEARATSAETGAVVLLSKNLPSEGLADDNDAETETGNENQED